MNKDLTVGTPRTVLWRFTLPMFASVIFQQLYNMADSVIAGKFAGEEALAAVGASYPITMIFMAIAIGSNIGCSVVVSRLFGAKNYAGVKTAVSTGLTFFGGASVAITSGGLLGTKALMQLINTPQNIFDQGALYLKIYILGFGFVYLYNVCTGVFSAMGDSKTPLIFLVCSSLGNVVLDFVFVAKFHWGVAGVAWATFICQGIACVLAMIALALRVKKFQSTGSFVFFSGSMLWDISKIALPSILQQSFVSVGNIFIQGLVNSFGSSVIAGYSAAIKLNTFAITGLTTLGNGISNFTAQNLGANAPHRVKQGLKSGIAMRLGVCVPFFVLYFGFGGSAVSLFLNSGSEVALQAGITFLKIVSPFYFAVAIKITCDGVLRGAGAMKPFMIATFVDLILRVVLAFVLAPIFGSTGVWASWPLGWIIAAIMSFWYYKKGVWNQAQN